MPDTSIAPLDLVKALAWVDGDQELLAELVAVFLEDLPARLQALRVAVQTEDAQGTERAAHSLKGAMASLGGETARTLAYEIEQMGRAGRLGGVQPLFAELEDELGRIARFASESSWREQV